MRVPNPFVHLDDHDEIDAKIISPDGTAPYVMIAMGGLTILTTKASQVVALRESCDKVIGEFRATTAAAMQSYVRNEWASAHPEEAVPLDKGGDCQACAATVDQLYRVARDFTGADIDADVCAPCAGVPVELAEALANAVKVGNPDQYGPDDVRAEQHDDEFSTNQAA